MSSSFLYFSLNRLNHLYFSLFVSFLGSNSSWFNKTHFSCFLLFLVLIYAFPSLVIPTFLFSCFPLNFYLLSLFPSSQVTILPSLIYIFSCFTFFLVLLIYVFPCFNHFYFSSFFVSLLIFTSHVITPTIIFPFP